MLMDYSDTGAAMAGAAAEGIVFMIMIAIYGAIFVAAIASYVVTAWAYYKLFKKFNKWESKAWMAWVPCANIYIQAMFLADQIKAEEWQKWCMAFYWIGSFIPYLGSVVTLAGSIICIIAYFKFMEKYNAPTWHYVMIFIFPIILPWLWLKYPYTLQDLSEI